MRILALDCATKTGWAFGFNGQLQESGVRDFAKKRGESNGILFLNFRKWLSDLITTCKPELVVYEKAHFRGGPATELCVGLQTRAMEIATEYHAEYAGFASLSIKKFATGSGKADKSVMITKATTILNRPPIDDNEADAVHILMMAFHEFETRKETHK